MFGYKIENQVLTGFLSNMLVSEPEEADVKLAKEVAKEVLGKDHDKVVYTRTPFSDMEAFVTRLHENGEVTDVILLAWRSSPARQTLIHELTHAKQILDGRLVHTMDEGVVYWEGERYTIPQLTDKESVDEYFSFPWEVESYRAQWESLPLWQRLLMPFKAWHWLFRVGTYAHVKRQMA